MRAWIEHDDDSSPILDIIVIDEESVITTSRPHRALPWRVEYDFDSILDSPTTYRDN